MWMGSMSWAPPRATCTLRRYPCATMSHCAARCFATIKSLPISTICCSSRSSTVAICSFGMTRTCIGAWGVMSLIAIISSSSCTILAGARLAAISQKIHAILPRPTLLLLLPLKQELHNLRHNVTGPLVQFVLREISNRMLHTQIFIIGQAPGLRHSPSSRLKHIGDKGGRWNAVLFKQNTVEHTARAARSSIADPGDDDIAVGGVFVDDFLVRRHPGSMLAAHNMALGTILLLQNGRDTEQQLIRVVLCILDQTNAHIAQRFWPGHEGNRLFLGLRGRIEHL